MLRLYSCAKALLGEGIAVTAQLPTLEVPGTCALRADRRGTGRRMYTAVPFQDVAMPKIMADPRLNPTANPMLFHGKRMTYD